MWASHRGRGRRHGGFGITATLAVFGVIESFTGVKGDQLHTAVGTIAGGVAHDLRVHRAGVTDGIRLRGGGVGPCWQTKIERCGRSSETGEQQKADEVEMFGNEFHIRDFLV
jgi:hypothetical protein